MPHTKMPHTKIPHIKMPHTKINHTGFFSLLSSNSEFYMSFLSPCTWLGSSKQKPCINDANALNQFTGGLGYRAKDNNHSYKMDSLMN